LQAAEERYDDYKVASAARSPSSGLIANVASTLTR
jgi:hypothetical protein